MCAARRNPPLDVCARRKRWDAPVFADDWFGAVRTRNAAHVVDAGRWAYTPVLAHARGWSNVTNPYGLLRSPWNTNPTPYLMRSRVTLDVLGATYSTFPNCSAFTTYLQSDWLVVVVRHRCHCQAFRFSRRLVP
jgi:hypothetical protein